MVRHATLLALVVAALGVTTPVGVHAGIIVTSGSGEAQASPDIVDIRLEIGTTADSALAATTLTTEKSEAVQAALGRLGIDRQEIVTTSFRVREKTDRNMNTGDLVYLGHDATHAIKVSIKDFAKIGPIVDAAMKAGATRLSGLDFRKADASALNDAALEAAVRQALQNATLMASAAGGHLGALVEINSEKSGYSAAPDSEMAGGAPAVPIVIVPDKLTVRMNVSARWEFVEE